MVQSTHHNLQQAGFTLLELLVTLALLLTLLLMAVPSMRHLLAENRSIAQVNLLSSGLNFARSEAVSQNEVVTFCKSADGSKCGGRWRDGQIILGSKGQVLRVFSAIPAGDDLNWNGSGGKDDAILWTPSGYTKGQRGTFYYCAANQDVEHSRTIVLWDTGRLYIAAMNATQYEQYCFK